MSIPSQTAMITMGKQTAKIGTGAIVAPATVLGVGALNSSVGIVDPVEQLSFVIGGGITPPGAYKTGPMGSVQLEAYLCSEAFTMLVLELCMGRKTTTTGAKWDFTTNLPEAPATTVGVNTHVFDFDPTGDYVLPWFSARSKLPGDTSGDTLGQLVYDAMAQGLSINVPAVGPVSYGFSGLATRIDIETAANANAWTYSNTLPGASSMIMASGSSGASLSGMKAGSDTFISTQIGINLVNNLSARQERVIGSYYMNDLKPMNRAITVSAVLMWNNPTLWNKLVTGSGTLGTDWAENAYLTETLAAVKGVDIALWSPGVIGVTAHKHMFKFHATSVSWSLAPQPIIFAPQNIVMIPIIGTVQRPSSGAYAEFALVNAVA
jgi:hypothetical protein